MLMVCDPRTTTTTSSGIFLDFNLVEGENEAGVRAATGAFLRCDMCPGLLVFVVQLVMAIEIRGFFTTVGTRDFVRLVVVVRGSHTVNIDEAIGMRINHVTAVDLLQQLRDEYYSVTAFDDMDESLLDMVDKFLESPKVLHSDGNQ